MIDDAIKINSEPSVKLDLTQAVASPETPDEELVKYALAGDEAAFAQIFERYRRLVVHLTGKFFRRREEIEEMSQQSFAKIYFSLSDFRGGHDKAFAGWLSKVTVNVCYDELRKRQRRSESVFSDFTEEEREYFSKYVRDESADAESKAVNRDLAEKMFAQLKAEERTALTLMYGEEMSVAEIAKTMGWSESNVKTRIMRCRNSLRKLFGVSDK